MIIKNLMIIIIIVSLLLLYIVGFFFLFIIFFVLVCAVISVKVLYGTEKGRIGYSPNVLTKLRSQNVDS